MSLQNFHTHSSDYGSDIDIDIDPPRLEEVIPEPESDYGSDIDLADDEALLHLLDNPPSPPLSPLYPPLPTLDDLAEDFTVLGAKPVVKTRTRFPYNGTLVIQYDELQPAATPDPPAAVLTTVSEAQPPVDPPDSPTCPARPAPTASYSPSPYDRFRSRRNQLSVTDLVSGVWCEQQFAYTLERGFKRSTPAMAAGTRLHKVLESEVHTTVPVEVTTREDRFALTLFNMSQGLLSLQETGITREFDVFGYISGVFVQGVIDEITYDKPDTDGFVTCPSSPIEPQHTVKAAYITDTKTRARATIPTGSQLRSTALQLMLYHRLLSLLPEVPFTDVLAHRKLDGARPLSDRFIAQVASMPSAIELENLLENNCLVGLWALVLQQMSRSVPVVGDTVGVIYRAQSDGRVMAKRAWGVDGVGLEAHLGRTMGWWRGELETVGVPVEGAWKCRICEFEEGCTWRLGQVKKMAVEVRKRKEWSGEEGVGKGEKASEEKVRVSEGGNVSEGEKMSEVEMSERERGSEGEVKKRGRKKKGRNEDGENPKETRSKTKRKVEPGSDIDINGEMEMEMEKVAKATRKGRGRSKGSQSTRRKAESGSDIDIKGEMEIVKAVKATRKGRGISKKDDQPMV